MLAPGRTPRGACSAPWTDADPRRGAAARLGRPCHAPWSSSSTSPPSRRTAAHPAARDGARGARRAPATALPASRRRPGPRGHRSRRRRSGNDSRRWRASCRDAGAWWSWARARCRSSDAPMPRRSSRSPRGGGHRVLTNNRYSSDVCAVSDAAVLRGLPPLPTDNALPRWLDEQRGYRVHELPGRRRLGIDLDGPLDLALLRHPAARRVRCGRSPRSPASPSHAPTSWAGVLAIGARSCSWLAARAPPRCAGWSAVRGAGSVPWSRNAACVPRASSRSAGRRMTCEAPAASPGVDPRSGARGRRSRRPRDARRRRSRTGPSSTAGCCSRTGWAPTSGAWPADEDRFASDLLRADDVRDPWLAALTRGAASAPVPVLLGAHTLVGPGSAAASRGPAWPRDGPRPRR